MTIQAIFNAKYLRWLMPIAGKERTRPYIQGVAVQPTNDGCYVVATTGTALGAVVDSAGYTKKPIIIGAAPYSVLLAKQARATKRIALPVPRWAVIRDDALFIVECSREEAESATDALNDPRIVSAQPRALIDATFPDWRRLVRTEKQADDWAAFNPAVLSVFKGVASGHVTVAITSSTGPAIVSCQEAPEFFGLVMPMRATKPEMPAWAMAA